MRSVCVFAGSATGNQDTYEHATAQLGTLLAERGIHLVYGGGGIGAMETVYAAHAAAGGTATGVIPRALSDAELAETRLDDMRVVESMHQRKALMAELSDAFIAVPGGLGTLEEFTEVTTWTQLGLHTKPTALLNTAGYYTGLLDFLEHAVTTGFLREQHRQSIVVADEPATLLTQLQDHSPTV